MGNFMDIFICDSCDTLATVSVSGDTILVNKCKCETERTENV
jgi:hypothetical protein